MSRRLYWCGDDGIRGCILRRVFDVLGFDILIPVSGPNPSSGKVPKRSSTFAIKDIVWFLKRRGCEDLSEIDRKWGVKPSGRGDIDFAAVNRSNGVAFVAEVKTRLIVSTIERYSLDVLRLMLQYHLDSPKNAEQAWAKLVERGIIKPPKPGAREYDNPASIAELTRSVVAFTISTHNQYRSLVPGVVTLCYVVPVLSDLITYINNTYKYLRGCGIEIEEPVAIILYPKLLANTPERITVKCVGANCKLLNLAKDVEVSEPLRGCTYTYLGCNECRYLRICSRYCTDAPLT